MKMETDCKIVVFGQKSIKFEPISCELFVCFVFHGERNNLRQMIHEDESGVE